MPCQRLCSAYLDEADVSSLLAEALTADVEAILADDTVAVTAHTAAGKAYTRIDACRKSQTPL